jgi:hypothetical protein
MDTNQRSASYSLRPRVEPPVFTASSVSDGRAPQELVSFLPFIYASEIFTHARMTTSAVLRHYP